LLLTPSVADVMVFALLGVLAVRVWVGEKRRRASQSMDERIREITLKVRYPMRHRLSATWRWMLG
jgi:hypothetical protein